MPDLAAARVTILTIVLLVLGAVPASGALRLQKVGDFEQPVYVTAAPGDDTRLYVVERAGTVKVVRGGTTLDTPFADLRDAVDTSGERGFLSIAFPPDFQRSRLLYAYYTNTVGDLHVDELRAPSGDRTDSSYRQVTISMPHPATNHNGGTVAFGPDGYLYLAPGDGAVSANAQDTSSLLGKVLRIAPTPGGGHTIPAGNPFGNEVWSYGLRNPFRFSFDRSTGDLVLGDVGASTVEEIDFAPASLGRGRGWNFGWPDCEGSYTQGSTTDPCTTGERPVIDHFQPDWDTINAGVVVRDPSLPSLLGRFVYGDTDHGLLYSARLRRPRAEDDKPLPFGLDNVAGFGQDNAGCVYAASLAGGVYRFVENSTGFPCGSSAPGGTADRVAPRLSVRVPRRQRVRRQHGAIAYARCSEACTVSMSGRLRLSRRVFVLTKGSKRLAAHRRATVRLRLTARAFRALRRKSRARVSVALRARDGAGNRTALLRRSVRVRR